VFVVGIESYSSANPYKVRVMNAGVGGSTAATWAADPNTNTYGSLSFINAINPDLTIICLGINDAAAGTPTATIVANIQTIATLADSWGDVVIVSGVPHNVSSSLDDLNEALKSLPYTYIDLYDRYGHDMITMGLMTSDGTHPNAHGYGDIAWAISRALLV
jgi:lysophospholipase L1-like esterase